MRSNCSHRLDSPFFFRRTRNRSRHRLGHISCRRAQRLRPAGLRDDAAVPMRHVLAEANIGYHQHVSHFALDGARRPLHDAILGPGAGGHFILLLRQSEQNDGRHSQSTRLAHFLHGFVYRKVEDAGHGAHFFADSRSGANEQWIHERFGREPGLADQGAQGFSAPQTAQAVGGECHSRQF